MSVLNYIDEGLPREDLAVAVLGRPCRCQRLPGALVEPREMMEGSLMKYLSLSADRRQ